MHVQAMMGARLGVRERTGGALECTGGAREASGARAGARGARLYAGTRLCERLDTWEASGARERAATGALFTREHVLHPE
ncbi:hypothetical protein CDL15_Pgr017647 [Punica granatum]|uniref:Uncharacterized protein n=1 Tax=Punica granatum TaxID=22663 RepID=A0A218XS21_PUNGR|nr:hypothetical protein CDL15_Pgr017647 [Punica granatum]PKI76909.1 hypothetical protein CRG98_002696 [Punica granatum]